jgi:hypothetical protein
MDDCLVSHPFDLDARALRAEWSKARFQRDYTIHRSSYRRERRALAEFRSRHSGGIDGDGTGGGSAAG